MMSLVRAQFGEPKRKRPSHDGLFLFGSPCYGENQYGFAVYCDGRSPSPFREIEPSNFAIATGRLTSEAFSESSGSRHKVAHSSRIVANFHLGTLGSICSLLCGENFGKNNSLSPLHLFSTFWTRTCHQM